MDCLLKLNPEGLWQCTRCGWIYPRKSAKPPRRNCPKAPDQPRRDPDEVAFIQELCESCREKYRKRCRPKPDNPSAQCPRYHW